MRFTMLAIGIAALVACHDLPDLGVCGNGIAEESNGEACDDGGESNACSTTCELKCTTSAITDHYVVVGADVAGSELYCPDSRFRCGVDAVCRAPSGRFAVISAPLAFDVSTPPVVGDVDNDGLPDLVGANATQIFARYGSSTAEPLLEVLLQDAPSSEGPLSIFELPRSVETADRSGMSIAVPTEGVAFLQSDNNRFIPDLELTFPVDVGALPVVARDPASPGLGDVVFSIQVQSINPSISVRRAEVPAPPGAAPGTPPLVPGASLDPCVGQTAGAWRVVDVVVADDRRTLVVVTRAVTSASWRVCRYSHLGQAWSLDSVGFAATAGFLMPPRSLTLANLDGDACAELAVENGSAIAYVDAAGAACAVGGLVSLSASPAGLLLAGGSIIPGQVDELVTTEGVFEVGPVVQRLGPSSDEWSRATVVDLNGDGILDVVAGRRSALNLGLDDVDVVRGGPILNSYRGDTTSPVTATLAGDFDGDRLGDVALVETTGAQDRISILYGTRDGIVGIPQVLSAFGGQLRVGRLVDYVWTPSSRGTDGIDDLLVGRADGTTLTGGILIGDARRVMTTPRFPPTKGGPLGDVVIAPFRTAALELVGRNTLRGGGEVSVHDIGTSSWENVKLGASIDSPLGSLKVGARSLLVGTVAIVATAPSTGLIANVRVFPVATGALPCESAPLDTQPIRYRGIDVDADGTDELAVYRGVDRIVSALELYRVGACATPAPLVAIPAALTDCVDVASTGDRLVALCRAGTRWFIYELDDTLERIPQAIAEVDGGGRYLTVGDFDGDAVLDIAVSAQRGTGVGVQVVRQCPAHDTRTCR